MNSLDQGAVLAEALGLTRPPPYVALGAWPTPVERLDALGSALGLELWVKRDDIGGAAYGGNKVRKLEYLLGAAHQRGCRSIITVGGVGSNQVVATALYARGLGIETHAAVFPQPVTPAVADSIRRAAALGVRLVPLREPNALAEVLERVRAEAPEPSLLIPAGGSSPTGNLGYVAAAIELRRQIDAGELPEPDEIFVAVGSGGTLAGLVLGTYLQDLRARLVGVRVAPEDTASETVVRSQIIALAGLLRRAGAEVTAAADMPFRLIDDAPGGAYGMPTAASERALALARDRASLTLDATYTAKAMAALVDGAARSGRVLFWHTANSRDLAGLPAMPAARPVPADIEAWLLRDAVVAPSET